MLNLPDLQVDSATISNENMDNEESKPFVLTEKTGEEMSVDVTVADNQNRKSRIEDSDDVIFITND
jgi:mRNA degradation ribonuclease J1/J2